MSAAVGALNQPRPRGWYLAREVGWLAGVSGARVGQWARRGYIRSSRSEGPPRVYSFQDVAEAIAVHELEDLGVTQRQIRRAVENLRRIYGDWPLTVAPLAVTQFQPARSAGGELLVRVAESGDLLDVARGEGTEPFFPQLRNHLAYLRGLLRSGGWVIQEHPDIESIEVDPDRLSGTPTIRGRRVPAEKVALLAVTPGGRDVLREDYKLTEREIDDAQRWYSAVAELEAA